MIAALSGTVLDKGEGRLVLEAGGVGFEVQVAGSTLAALTTGASARLWIAESVAMYGGGTTLYGFASKEERDIFLAVKEHVPNTGAKKALEVLERASKSLPDFRRAVLEKDVRMLAGVFGFTKKTAERLAEALQDKLGRLPVPGVERFREAPLPASPHWTQALQALASLGYRPQEARSALAAVEEELGVVPAGVEEVIRRALKRL